MTSNADNALFGAVLMCPLRTTVESGAGVNGGSGQTRSLKRIKADRVQRKNSVSTSIGESSLPVSIVTRDVPGLAEICVQWGVPTLQTL